jgi:hypothetical protein
MDRAARRRPSRTGGKKEKKKEGETAGLVIDVDVLLATELPTCMVIQR